VAGLEAGAAGGPGGKTGAPAGRRSPRNASGSGDDSTGTGGAAAAGVEGDSRIAAIDVPGGRVKVDEEYRPQTLGGVLPLVLGVNEEGRFDFDQYSLRPEVKRILDELAEKLKTAEYDRLDIVGYTDRIGTNDYNRRLSELRAYAVAQYLMSKGVPENKIRYEGRGDKDPLTPAGHCRGLAREELITCLQNDRRVEIEASIHRKHATVIQ
jgi:OOP family OmpA-OmpF porin